MRFLLLSLLSLLTFLGHAQESIVATTVVEKDDAPVIAQTAPATVEVGRHVMGNIDAGSMIVSLLAVLVAIVIVAWLLKKLQVGGNSVNGLKVVTSLNLGSKERLVVVQVGKKQLLLGVTGQQINILDTLAEPIEVKSGVPIELSQTLARFSRNSANKANSEKYS
ncbi:MAG: flagellar protein FliO/FliZ [Colwellia sp.]|jgi:flagellar protein FliO/FliZ|uniref:flagellar biosynthetic protein FliO n=1 Tax=unclassified Colwellia TaxID=196834 RepID=UPI0015F451BF|nr:MULTISPECIES: flagellar biosynthetic protein FliO [unclassified Colwellia]MBA6253822.1 flagellar biosynthetic protein FliO [Colwellia sp. MB3u-55]MBA6396467.1 flagellar biosynthetic protein FliO [Colwellia sp. BRX10-4]